MMISLSGKYKGKQRPQFKFEFIMGFFFLFGLGFLIEKFPASAEKGFPRRVAPEKQTPTSDNEFDENWWDFMIFFPLSSGGRR